MRIEEIPIPTYYGDEICYVNGLQYARDVTRDVIYHLNNEYKQAGGVAPLRAGLTLVKDARKVGRLGEDVRVGVDDDGAGHVVTRARPRVSVSAYTSSGSRRRSSSARHSRSRRIGSAIRSIGCATMRTI